MLEDEGNYVGVEPGFKYLSRGKLKILVKVSAIIFFLAILAVFIVSNMARSLLGNFANLLLLFAFFAVTICALIKPLNTKKFLPIVFFFSAALILLSVILRLFYQKNGFSFNSLYIYVNKFSLFVSGVILFVIFILASFKIKGKIKTTYAIELLSYFVAAQICIIFIANIYYVLFAFNLYELSRADIINISLLVFSMVMILFFLVVTLIRIATENGAIGKTRLDLVCLKKGAYNIFLKVLAVISLALIALVIVFKGGVSYELFAALAIVAVWLFVKPFHTKKMLSILFFSITWNFLLYIVFQVFYQGAYQYITYLLPYALLACMFLMLGFVVLGKTKAMLFPILLCFYYILWLSVDFFSGKLSYLIEQPFLNAAMFCALYFIQLVVLGWFLINLVVENFRLSRTQDHIDSVGKKVLLTIFTLGAYGGVWVYEIMDRIYQLSGEEKPKVWRAVCFMICPFYCVYWANVRSKKLFAYSNYTLENNSSLVTALMFFGLSIIALPLIQSDLNILAARAVIAEKAEEEQASVISPQIESVGEYVMIEDDIIDTDANEDAGEIKLLRDLKILYEEGVITKEEFLEKKRQILDRM